MSGVTKLWHLLKSDVLQTLNAPSLKLVRTVNVSTLAQLTTHVPQLPLALFKIIKQCVAALNDLQEIHTVNALRY